MKLATIETEGPKYACIVLADSGLYHGVSIIVTYRLNTKHCRSYT